MHQSWCSTCPTRGAVYLREDLAGALVLKALVASAASVFGRPVLMDGTACRAVRSAPSDRVASTFKPARNSSLFLTGWANADARCLRASITAYSSLGIVKLSRTSLGFFAFASLAATGAAVLAGFVTAIFLAAGAFLATGFAAAFTVFVVFATVTEAAVGVFAGFTDLAGAGTGGAAKTGAEAGVEVVVMAVLE